MKKIVLVNCYFGKFPWYFSFFIKSCETNPTVDFMIFSDSKYDGYLPENVKIIPFTLTDFNLLGTAKLGFEIAVKKAYKLCDFKPAYGLIFSEYIRNYDFWGMCDIDIVLGRIREFMTEELLNKYDVINTRHDYLAGSFLLFKNTPKINNLYAKSKDHRKVFTSEIHYCFDECNFKHMELELGKRIHDVPCEIESMEHIIQREMNAGGITVFYDFLVIDGLSGKLKWDNGLLSYNDKFEILLFHLIQYKSNYFSKKQMWNDIPNLFYIDKYMFRINSKKTFTGMFEFFKYNKYIPLKSFLLNSIDYILSKIINRKPLKNLTEGVYKNKLGDTFIFIEKNNIGENLIFFNSNSNRKRKINLSISFDNTFFSSMGFLAKYIFFESSNGNTEKIQKIMYDGSVSDFEYIKQKQASILTLKSKN